MSNEWMTRPAEDETAAQLRDYRIKVRDEIRQRTGRVPTLARIDQVLASYWYRLPEQVASRVQALVGSRRKLRNRDVSRLAISD